LIFECCAFEWSSSGFAQLGISERLAAATVTFGSTFYALEVSKNPELPSSRRNEENSFESLNIASRGRQTLHQSFTFDD